VQLTTVVDLGTLLICADANEIIAVACFRKDIYALPGQLGFQSIRVLKFFGYASYIQRTLILGTGDFDGQFRIPFAESFGDESGGKNESKVHRLVFRVDANYIGDNGVSFKIPVSNVFVLNYVTYVELLWEILRTVYTRTEILDKIRIAGKV